MLSKSAVCPCSHPADRVCVRPLIAASCAIDSHRLPPGRLGRLWSHLGAGHSRAALRKSIPFALRQGLVRGASFRLRRPSLYRHVPAALSVRADTQSRRRRGRSHRVQVLTAFGSSLRSYSGKVRSTVIGPTSPIPSAVGEQQAETHSLRRPPPLPCRRLAVCLANSAVSGRRASKRCRTAASSRPPSSTRYRPLQVRRARRWWTAPPSRLV